MFIFTFQLMPPKVIHTIVSGSGLPLTKVCLKSKTDQRKIYKKIRETLVENRIINPNTGLEWTIHGEEIMINHFVDLSELLRISNKGNNTYNNEYTACESVYDIKKITTQNEISSELKHLYNLEELQIYSSIADEQLIILSGLYSLKKLAINTSSIDTLIIPNECTNLKNLHTLVMDGYGRYGNQDSLTSAPHKLGILQNLKRLDLAHNNIDSTVESLESITQLKNLEYLSLSWNNLTRLPDIFDRLLCLRELNISVNNISEYPSVINKIQTLECLNISHNKLTIFPDIQLPNLCNLHIDNNKIEDNYIDDNGSINIPKLENLSLTGNKLSTIPEFIYSLQNLRELSLTGNRIQKSDLDAYKSKYPNVNAD